MTYRITTAAPSWARLADRQTDISDIWNGACPDDENITECIAYFEAKDVLCSDERHEDFIGTGFDLVGIRVDDGVCPVYYDRAAAMNLFEMPDIWRIEQHEMEAAQ